MTARDHGIDVAGARLQLISDRVRSIALCFALLTLAWIAIDVAAFERRLWLPLALGRMATALAFAAIAVEKHDPHKPYGALWWLGALFSVPAIFFVYSLAVMTSVQIETMPVLLTTAYLCLPFVVMTGLALFPLTLQESVLLVGPLLITFGAAMLFIGFPAELAPSVVPLTTMAPKGLELAAMMWPITLVAGVATIAGMNQLQYLVVAARRSAHDGLTGLYTRRFGEELFELLFQASERAGTALTAVFIDLDRFKHVNDDFGHDAGDAVLRAAARAVSSALRRQDVAIRWGGEEFLVLMPNTSAVEAQYAIARIAQAGLGRRPDGRAQTASLGMAERKEDNVVDWMQFVRIADDRMYAAKAAGRNRIVGIGDAARPFRSGANGDESVGRAAQEPIAMIA